MFPTGDMGLLNINTPLRILRIIYQLINRFDKQYDRYSILKYAIQKATRSIYTIVHEVGVQDQEHGRYELRGNDLENPDPEEYRTVNPQQLDHLELLAAEKINLWVEKGQLAKNEHLDEILLLWENWEGKSKVKTYVDNLIKDDIGLIDFITGFTKEYSTWNLNDKVATTYWKINIESMKNFVSLDEVEPRIKNLHTSSKFKQLSSKNRIAIERFIERKNELNQTMKKD